MSSDWKEVKPTDDDYVYLISKLALCGLSIDGQTGSDVQKGRRDLKYLKAHPEIEEYVVLDDCRLTFKRPKTLGTSAAHQWNRKRTICIKPRRWRQSCLGII